MPDYEHEYLAPSPESVTEEETLPARRFSLEDDKSEVKTEKPEWVEPKMKFRFRVQFSGMEIPDYLFRKYKLYNDGEKLIFETSIYETG